MGIFGKMKKYGLKYGYYGLLQKVGIKKLKYTDLCIQDYFLKLPPERREDELKIWFKRETGNDIDFENINTFNEKIQWLKLYDSTPTKTKLADKYLVRDWVAEKIGEKYLIPLLGVWDRFDDISFDKLPSRFVLKCVHGSGMNIIVRDKSKMNIKDAERKINFWMKDYYGIGPMQEWHYRDIPHRIIAEQYMENMAGDLYDYKFYCFNGEPKYVQIIKGRSTDSQMGFYDLQWNDAGFTYKHFGEMKQKPEKPRQFDDAVIIAGKLCEGFPFVRVDLYLVGDKDIYFGEMTFTPASGVRHWVPQDADRKLGDLLKLPEKKYIMK